MRTLDAINAGYDEITHIYFATMQAMPQEVVDKSNTTMRLLGPGKYFKDVDLDAEPTKTVISDDGREEDRARSDPGRGRGRSARQRRERSRRLMRLMSGTLPAATERGFKSGPIPYLPGMTRADAQASVHHMGEYVDQAAARRRADRRRHRRVRAWSSFASSNFTSRAA